MRPHPFAATVLLLIASTSAHAKRDKTSGPAASAAEIPALASLLGKAGWESTPELSSVFVAGGLYEATELGHRLVSKDCIEVEPTRSAYTSAELVTSLQSGVSIRAGAGKVEASGSLTRKMRFGTPEQLSIPLLQFTLSKTCTAQLKALPADRQDRIYAVQEVLVAEISEQTCGRIDASGKFVGLGEADMELAQACAIASLEPVAVGYRVAPLSDLLGGGKPAPPPPAAALVAEAAPGAGDSPTSAPTHPVFTPEVVAGIFRGIQGGDLAYQVEAKFGKPTAKGPAAGRDEEWEYGGVSFFITRKGVVEPWMSISPPKLTPEQRAELAALLPEGLLDLGSQEAAAVLGADYSSKDRWIRITKALPGMNYIRLKYGPDHKTCINIFFSFKPEG